MIRSLLASFAIFIAAIAMTTASQKDPFKIAIEEVRMDVFVADHGKPLMGLGTTNFEILDNGVPQEILYAKLQKQMPLNVTLVFDMSSSVAGELFDALKDAARVLLDNLRTEDHAALITFNNAIVLGSQPTHDFAQIRAALDRAKPIGNTSLMDGSYAGLVLAETIPDPPVLIIFSDGLDTFSWLTSDAVLETAKRSKAVVYAVSTSRLPQKTFLGDLTSIAGGSLIEVKSVRDLSDVFLDILEEFRQRYIVTYTPRGVPEKGWHKVSVRVKHRSAKVRVREGYTRR